MRLVALALLLAACGGAATPEPKPAEAPVAAAPAAPAEAAPAAALEGRRVEVTIEHGSYTPAEITAQPGEKLVLVFHNNDGSDCGRTVRLPSTGESKTVEQGGTVELGVTAPASGKLEFGCSMEHCHVGAVVVGS